ncbi:MAG: MFS transporter [Verrucomicrobia bacterium]|nr:MFS transporter [Verrucomicrobiota bacterium]
MGKTSIFVALRNPVFKRLWIMSIISGCCVSAHDTAATWMMSKLSHSSFLISLISTVASLPFFLFTLPAGALADMVDRRRLLFVMNIWLGCAAGGLAILTALHLLHPYLILLSVFLIGIGFSFYAPAWSAVVPEVVSKEHLASAVTLGGLQLNIAGIVGPALGGLALASLGAQVVFATNAVCFFLLLTALTNWGPAYATPKMPFENFLDSLASAVRYVRYAPGIQVILVRDVIFSLFIAVIPALLPVVGLRQLGLDSSKLGLLFTSMGIGAVAGAVVVIPWARARFSANTLTILANLLLAIVFLLMAFVRDPDLFMVVAALAGVGWTLTASELWVAGQRAMPSWARGRMNATHMMVSQGGLALGGLIWGAVAAFVSLDFALISAALFLLFSLSLAIPLSIDFTKRLNLDPAPLTTQYHRFLHVPDPSDGPVIVIMVFEIDVANRRLFLDLMREMRLIYLRNGAFSWRLDEDLEKAGRFRMEMMVSSWSEHLQQHERMTKNELATWRKVWSLHSAREEPIVKHYLSVHRELLMRRPAPLDVERPTQEESSRMGRDVQSPPYLWDRTLEAVEKRAQREDRNNSSGEVL